MQVSQNEVEDEHFVAIFILTPIGFFTHSYSYLVSKNPETKTKTKRELSCIT